MTITEYRNAVKAARRILGFVQFSETRRGSMKLSKRAALAMVAHYDGDVDAIWVDDGHTILLVG